MRVKTQHFLQPQKTDAHSVIIENNAGQPIYAALEASDGSIIAAQAGDADFAGLLKTLGVDKTVAVYSITPKTVEQMKALF